MVEAVMARPKDSHREAALRDLYEEVHTKNLFPFWATSTDVEHDEIKQLLGTQRAIPCLWDYQNDLEPLLRRSAELVTMEDTERRSLILVNPGLAPRRATVTTMYTAYRLNDPNEVMPPHKHTASAVRLGLTGSQNFTGVEGEDIVFGPGDLVLTPRDTWHNHGNQGDAPAVNLSVLDLPLVEQLNALSFAHDYQEGEVKMKAQSARYSPDHSREVYGSGGLLPRFVDHRRGFAGGSSPMFVYRYDMMRELLEKHRDVDACPFEGLLVEYVDPLSGGPVFKTMGFFMQMLRPGEKTLPLSQTASLLIAPIEGEGTSIVDGETFDWHPFDTLAVPGGAWLQHENRSTSPAILFIASDEPAQKAFGLLRRSGRRADGELVRLV